MKVLCAVLLIGMMGCGKPVKQSAAPKAQEFAMLEDACSGHMYWRVNCDKINPHCTAQAWTGSPDPWQGHTQEWRVYDNDRDVAANKLAKILSGPPNVDLTDYDFDSGVRECVRPKLEKEQ